MTIAEISEKYSISKDTIRYYEKVGLIPNVPRSKSGIRNFDEESCRWLEFILCMRSAGMPIEALTEYVKLFREGKKTIKRRKELLVSQREILLKKRSDLDDTIKRLDKKIDIYTDIELGKRKDFMEE